MTRRYSDELVQYLNDPTVENTVGVRLGRLCVEAKIPAVYVAHATDVSRLAVHAWFRGGDIRRHNRRIIEILIEHLQQDMDSGVLPAKSRQDAKQYIEGITGMPIT
jgi:hypothetical protein